MSLEQSRLDNFISRQCNISRKNVRLLLAQKRVLVDGIIAVEIAQQVHKFSHIILDGQLLQANKACYIMLNKPIGVVCATKDEKHKTVIDLLQDENKNSLHLVGRLDLNSSGLVLLTNDSRWSKYLTSPEQKIEKRYIVTVKNPISLDYISAFAQGFYFSYENITTRPAILRIISTYKAEVILTEGRYHQIKRMFGYFRNPVTFLHRTSIGQFILDDRLKIGESRTIVNPYPTIRECV